MERPRAKLTEWKVLPDIWGEEKVYFLKGRIEGHPALDDGACAETSHITDCKIDKHTGEIIFYTEKYRLPLQNSGQKSIRSRFM